MERKLIKPIIELYLTSDEGKKFTIRDLHSSLVSEFNYKGCFESVRRNTNILLNDNILIRERVKNSKGYNYKINPVDAYNMLEALEKDKGKETFKRNMCTIEFKPFDQPILDFAATTLLKYKVSISLKNINSLALIYNYCLKNKTKDFKLRDLISEVGATTESEFNFLSNKITKFSKAGLLTDRRNPKYARQKIYTIEDLPEDIEDLPEDIIAGFIEDICETGADKKIPIGDLYSKYQEWLDKACQDILGKKEFGNLMRQKGYSQNKSGGVRYWTGITIKEELKPDTKVEEIISNPSIIKERFNLLDKDTISTIEVGISIANLINHLKGCNEELQKQVDSNDKAYEEINYKCQNMQAALVERQQKFLNLNEEFRIYKEKSSIEFTDKKLAENVSRKLEVVTNDNKKLIDDNKKLIKKCREFETELNLLKAFSGIAKIPGIKRTDLRI